MKTAFYCTLILALSSCCLGKRDCGELRHTMYFRLIDKTNQNDLVFGSSSRYNPDSIIFYTRTGLDSQFIGYAVPQTTYGTGDSVLVLYLNNKQEETVFVKLNNSETDTLQLKYPIKELKCCPDISVLTPVGYNGQEVEGPLNGVFVIRK